MSYRYFLATLAFSATVLRLCTGLEEKGGFTRKVTLSHNPGCSLPECATENLIYAKAQGANDSLHYILSTVGGSSPTLLLLRSEHHEATLKINWTSFIRSPIDDIHGSVHLVSKRHHGKIQPVVKSVIIFDQLMEYNDTEDTASMPVNESERFSPIMLNQLKWEVNMTNELSSRITGTTDRYPKSLSPNSSISLNFSLFGSTGRSDELPSLPQNANSSKWEFILDSLLPRGIGSRFGVQLSVLGFSSDILKLRSKTINDEYAPSIFTSEKLEWIGATKEDSSGENALTFHQWRAVSYTTVNHERKMATDVKTGDFVNDCNSTSSSFEDLTSNRLLRAYFSLRQINTSTVKSTIVAFGKPEDGFYAATNYTSWTSSIGFNKPPADEFSTLIICMLVAGIGCPLIVIILGGIYVIWIRVKRSNRGIKNRLITNYDYQPIET